MLKNILNIAFSLLIINVLYSQGTLKINGTNLVASGNVHLVLDNTSLQNAGTFTPSTSTVHIKGNASEAQSIISGTSPTAFYNLTINKSANNAQMWQNISVGNDLTLTQGCLDVGNYNLAVVGAVSYANTCFVKTSGTGILKRNVGNSAVLFPVGYNSFTPLLLQNAGTADNFTVRVSNQVLGNGSSGTVINSAVVNATWHVTEEVAGGSNVTMTATWNSGDEAAGFSRSRSYIQYYLGSSWQSTTPAAATGNNPYSISRSGLTSFSPFSVGSSATLPLELLNFSGYTEGGQNRLIWTTANELNNKGFQVERSPQPAKGALEKWDILGFVNSKGKAASYEFLDAAPPLGAGGAYYRLRQVDNDGKETLSKVISLSNTLKSSLKIYPNPATDVLTIEVIQGADKTNKMKTFHVFNILGKQVLTGNLNQSVDISSLSNGTYIVKVGEEQVKFVKQ